MSGLPVLTFHAIDDGRTPVAVAAATFDSMIRRLVADGAVATDLDALLAYLRGGRPLSKGAVLPTFDDGYASVAGACETLFEAGLRPILFLCPRLMGRSEIFPGDPLCPKQRALTWDEAAALARKGATVGSHAYDHVDLRGLSDAALDDSLRRSRAELEDRLGVAVRSLAYPFGFHDARVVRAASKVYDAAFTTRLARVGAGADAFRLPRLDAWYLRFLAERGSLDSVATRAYLAVRRVGRAVKASILRGAS